MLHGFDVEREICAMQNRSGKGWAGAARSSSHRIRNKTLHIVDAYPKAPKRVLGLLGEGFGFGGEGLGPHYKGPGSLG